jgi:hypothetical protein
MGTTGTGLFEAVSFGVETVVVAELPFGATGKVSFIQEVKRTGSTINHKKDRFFMSCSI